ncbi:MAG: family 78 glycoside hydrolase catalytic domain, partial [Lachnospiraceae bacterium]|nr:family 78 glycoside hydrolase catalytic domain [Lachnospiraceae bacterium]
VTFDVTQLLQEGENALLLEVGNGWYILDGEYYTFHFPPFMPPNPNPYRPFGMSLVTALRLEITYKDGTQEIVETDESFRTAPHAVQYSNVYGSEKIDAGRFLELAGESAALRLSETLSGEAKYDELRISAHKMSRPEYDDRAWEAACPANPDEIPAGVMKEQKMPPVKIIRTYDGKALLNTPQRKIYDLSQNISGLLSVQIRGRKGCEVRFFPAEKLDENGVPDQMAKGWMPIDNCITFVIGEDNAWETFSQTFTYFAGRYFLVEADEPFEIRTLCGQAITSAWERSGRFTCDDERFNKIYDMIEKTVEANMIGVHTDCPTIERFAWQEPNHLMAPSIFYMKNGKELWRKFLADCRDAQHGPEDVFYDFEGNAFLAGDGLVPSQAPCYIPNVLPVPGMGSFYDIIAWGSTIILGTWWHYWFYGDASILTENYEAGKRYFSHLLTMVTPEGFIAHGLGDWGNPENQLLRENTETVFLYADAVRLSWMADELGKVAAAEQESAAAEQYCADAAYYLSEAQKIRDNYNERLLVQNPATGCWYYRPWESAGKEESDQKDSQAAVSLTQASQALPLYFGMVPEDKVQDVAEAFREALTSRGALVSGEVGMPYIIQTARRYGMNDLIAQYIVREEHPSYYAFILDGETTLGEYWEKNPRSHCHDMMGHIIEWYYNGIAGIEPAEPGFAAVRIHPYLPENMNSFTCSYETPHGMICVEAHRENGRPVYDVKVPEKIRVFEQENDHE